MTYRSKVKGDLLGLNGNKMITKVKVILFRLDIAGYDTCTIKVFVVHDPKSIEMGLD